MRGFVGLGLEQYSLVKWTTINPELAVADAKNERYYCCSSQTGSVDLQEEKWLLVFETKPIFYF